MTIVSLPSLRRKILRAFLSMVLLYVFLGLFLVSGIMIETGTTPKLIHVNYDSIAAGFQMREAVTALRHPDEYPGRAAAQWKLQFEHAITFEETNITEPGEGEIARGLRADWEKVKAAGDPIRAEDFTAIRSLIEKLVAVNEKAMFKVAGDNEELSGHVIWGTFIYFLMSLLLVVFTADNLAERLSRPMKQIAEALHRDPGFGKKLKFPAPTSLELLILTTEISRLWDRVSESERVNVREIVQQKNKLTTVLESVEDALLVVDADGCISHCNECMLTLLGLPSERVIRSPWADLSTANDNYLTLRAVLGLEMPNSQEVELTLEGTKRQYSARSKQIRDPGKDTTETLYLLHDITEKRQREKFRAEFIDLLSHEIKTPLQSLGTACEILQSQKESLSENLKLMVDTIIEDTERIRAVANEFVQVTQSHSKILKLKLTLIALNQTLPEWIKPFQVVAKDRKVKLRFEQQGSPVIWGNLDVVKFPWVISNLLSNAIRFSPVGGEVVVILTDRNGSVEINVVDEGPGVTDQDQKRIFEPFFQSPLATGSGLKGLFGIGLTIAKEVVEAHDGRIEYYPRRPKGSEFRIVLPFPPQNYS